MEGPTKSHTASSPICFDVSLAATKYLNHPIPGCAAALWGEHRINDVHSCSVLNHTMTSSRSSQLSCMSYPVLFWIVMSMPWSTPITAARMDKHPSYACRLACHFAARISLRYSLHGGQYELNENVTKWS